MLFCLRNRTRNSLSAANNNNMSDQIALSVSFVASLCNFRVCFVPVASVVAVQLSFNSLLWKLNKPSIPSSEFVVVEQRTH